MFNRFEGLNMKSTMLVLALTAALAGCNSTTSQDDEKFLLVDNKTGQVKSFHYSANACKSAMIKENVSNKADWLTSKPSPYSTTPTSTKNRDYDVCIKQS